MPTSQEDVRDLAWRLFFEITGLPYTDTPFSGATAGKYLQGDGTWGTISVPSVPYGGVWSTQGSNFNAAAGNGYIITANSVTATLPGSPADKDIVGPFVNKNGVTGFVVARNGKKIMNLSEDMTVDVGNFSFGLIYYATDGDWRLF